MNKHFAQLLLVAIILTACGPAVLPPLPTAIKTQIVIPSETPSPTQTTIPTATPYPPLQTKGPYLLFGARSFTMMDADGTGRKQFDLPNNGRMLWNLNKAVSPNGKWLAYYTGSKEEPYDLALNLFNLTDGKSQFISNLIAPGFPENLAPVTQTMYFVEGDAECENDLKCKLRKVQTAFIESIDTGNALAWSPDGKLLAFAAQIDGPSSDIYLFNTEDNSIRRLTDEPENISSIDWSPDGRKILYENSVPGVTYKYTSIHIADPNIKSLQHPKAVGGIAFWYKYGWIDQNSYLVYYSGEGAPPNHLRIIDTKNQTATVIWKYSAESFFVDLKNKLIILSPYGRIYLRSEPEAGIYTVSFDRTYKKVSEVVVYFIEGQDAVDQYIAITQENQLVGVKLDGSITPLSRKPDYNVPPHASSDGKWIVINNETETEIYSGDLQLIKSLGIHATDIVWRPDSTGVFLYSDPALYYLPTGNNESKLIGVCTLGNCSPYKYVWLP